MKIVVIEDEIRIREGLTKLIEKLDKAYEVVGTAENGEEGYHLVKETAPDAVVTDIKMPLMDGLEMLTRLYKEGFKGKTVVLSAYSEFEYARQAMRLGVKEYLLKPIVVSDISQALLRISEEIRKETVQDKVAFSNAEQIFEGLLWGNLEPDADIQELLEREYQLSPDNRYIEFCFYMGDFYHCEHERVKREAERMLHVLGGVSWLCLESERSRIMVFLLHQVPDEHEAERFVQKELLQWKERKPFEGVGWHCGLRIEELREGLERLERHLEWNISLGDEVLISYPKVTSLVTSPCIYPIDLEGQMKVHICAGDRAALQKDMETFTEYFQRGSLYTPREIKECYVRFLWAMMNMAKETGMLREGQLRQQALLEQITTAKTRAELGKLVDSLMEAIFQQEDEDSVHLTVKRAQSMIREFYQTGITLDEIAARLNITPEYLGTRFYKELGVHFSTYIKNYRITKAKEMLVGTSMKLYEIAEKVGYSDPKYFSRVFKEATGQLPADYRKTHR